MKPYNQRDRFHLDIHTGFLGSPYLGKPHDENHRGHDLVLPLNVQTSFYVANDWRVAPEASVGLQGTNYGKPSPSSDGYIETHRRTGMAVSAGAALKKFLNEDLSLNLSLGWRANEITGRRADGAYALIRAELHPCGWRAFATGGLGGTYYPSEDNGAILFYLGAGFTFF